MAVWSVPALNSAFNWRRVLSTLTPAVVVGSMLVGMAIYPRVQAATAEATRFFFPMIALIVTTLLGLEFSLCGYVILRQTANRVGWLLQGTGLLFGFTWVGLALTSLDEVGRNIGVAGRLAASWLGFGWYPALMLMGVLLPLLFPTGRPPSRKWAWVAVTAGIALVYGLGAVTMETLSGPLAGVLGPDSKSWLALSALAATGVCGAGISVLVRYRRANAVERLQIKWVVITFVLLCLTITLSLTPVVQLGPDWGQALAYTMFSLVPVSIVLAITRYRLYDLDRIISRTLSYAIVVGALLALYTGALALLTQVLPGQSDVAVAASTLAAMALFTPIKRRIQAWVDRRFNRTRYKAEKELNQLTERLKEIVDLATLETDVIGVVRRTLQPSATDVWLRNSNSL